MIKRKILPKNSKDTIIKILFSFYKQTDRKDRKNLILLGVIMIFCSILDVITISSVLPFLQIISKQSYLNEYDIFNKIIKITNFGNPILLAGFLIIITSALALILRIYNLKLIHKVSARIASKLSNKIYSNLLHNEYEYHLKTNSSNLINSVLNDIPRSVSTLQLVNQLIYGILSSLFIVGALFVINSKITLLSLIFLSTLYFFIAIKVKRKLARNSSITLKNTISQTKLVQESLDSIKEVILYSNQNLFLQKYKKIDYPIHRLKGENQILYIFPKYIFETLGIIFIISIGILFGGINGNNTIIATLGVFAFATQKLLPAFQNIYSSWANIRANKINCQRVNEFTKLDLASDFNSIKVNEVKFKKSFNLQNINFSFKNNQIFKNLNLSINPGDKIGIIGETGSGKSTLINIILGLLKPTKGSILIDDLIIELNSNYRYIRGWQNLIAYVPQNVTLHDISLLENIAFGIELKKIDINKVKRVAKYANIEKLIKLKNNGLNTQIGERGIEISGGEAQRIGIARALYKEPEILILDESTSSLDVGTEKKVIESIFKYSKTLIITSHRLSTLKECNKIFYLNRKKLLEINFKDAENYLLNNLK